MRTILIAEYTTALANHYQKAEPQNSCRRPTISWRNTILLFAICCFCALQAQATPIDITISTPGLVGRLGTMIFDFIDGTSVPNQIAISGLTTDGVLGQHQSDGAINGDLRTTLLLKDSDFLNEFRQQIILGTSLSFTLDSTSGAAGRDEFPDGLSLYLLDANTTTSLTSTTDPSGADALFLLNIGASPSLAVYAGTGFSVSTSAVAIPEPSTLSLASISLLFGLFSVAWRNWGTSKALFISVVPNSIPSQHCSFTRRILLGLLILLILCATRASAADVTSMMDIKRSGLVLNRTSNTFDSSVTITNVGAQSVNAPIRLFVQITPSTVSLANGTGVSSDGKAYIELPLPSGKLNQGQALTTLVKINNLPKQKFSVVFTIDANPEDNGNLPPDPGPDGEKTLLGIDSDHDGVRDDIQRYIALAYPTEPNALHALRKLTMDYQAMLTIPAGDANAAKSLSLQAWRHRSCLVFLYGSDEGHRRANALFSEQFNTISRYRVWSQQDDLLAGEVFESPPKSAANCDFVVNIH